MPKPKERERHTLTVDIDADLLPKVKQLADELPKESRIKFGSMQKLIEWLIVGALERHDLA